MKKWILIVCVDRELSLLGSFSTEKAAKDAMVADFLSVTGYSTLDEFDECYDKYEPNAFINNESAWCSSKNGDSVDWCIFEIDV